MQRSQQSRSYRVENLLDHLRANYQLATTSSLTGKPRDTYVQEDV